MGSQEDPWGQVFHHQDPWGQDPGGSMGSGLSSSHRAKAVRLDFSLRSSPGGEKPATRIQALPRLATHSQSTSFMRVCQPAPVPLKYATTSGS